ncbi:MAG: glycoside hydrolase family 2 TIM barrel-domain containing protein [Bacteroidales bacterium]
MNLRELVLMVLMTGLFSHAYSQSARKEQLFDDGWKFCLGDIKNAEKPSFNDKAWREVDLPHDWSIERLSGQKTGEVVGPFSKESIGTTATGYTVGGTAWYRKTFVLNPGEKFSRTIISFDGVYMNAEVWVNGRQVGIHPYGYTAFHFDITQFLNPTGKANTIAVKVKNEGKNSRWYSGSGIYRHVWLIQKQSVSIAHYGLSIVTENINAKGEANIKIAATIDHKDTKGTSVKLMIKVIGPDGKVVQTRETQPETLVSGQSEITQNLTIPQAKLWSVEESNLYKAEVQVIADGNETDKVTVTFGIRTIHFSAQNGFLLNGKKVLLKGGCLHHDNGFLGSATIDRAEERRVELMKAYGFNAIRASHNPPSGQFLDACDRVGVLVIDEAFDMWERPKNPEDYHLYFRDWWKKDLESMVYRDRNHPSIIMWSIGNELNERADSSGFLIRKKLVAEVHKLDPTRPVTEAICNFWDHPGQEWQTTAPAFADLDVGGYNYLHQQYDADHVLFPNRIIVGTESFALEAYDNWKQMEKNPWVIGDFVWTAMDYLGETACGNSSYAPKAGPRVGLKPWPWFNAFCGDIDLCGFKKPQMYYKDVVWNNSKLELMVHAPVPDGMVETVSYWGWPDEYQSWNWTGYEGTMMDVRVFSNCQAIRLELNGKVIAEQPVHDTAKYIVLFKVPYEPGILKAKALINGIEVASKEIRTTGNAAKIKLTADRNRISANRNDLSYVKVEVTDEQGNVIPNAEIPVTFKVSGQGEIAGSGNACPTDMESFNNTVCKTYRGQALVILRPLKEKTAGTIHLSAGAPGLKSSEISVFVQ